MAERRLRDGRTVKVKITWETAGIAACIVAGVPLLLFLSSESIRRRAFVAFCSFVNGKEKVEMTDIKRRLLRDVKGKVVELGPGPGLNFRILATNARVERWIGIEPNPYFHSLIQANAEKFGAKFEIEIHADGAEKLSLANESVDTVIFTHVLCSCDDMQAVLREVDRVLKVGGSFYFLEHIAAAEGTWMRWIQDKIDPAWQFVFSGCKFLDTQYELENLGDRYDSYMRTFDAPMPIALGSSSVLSSGQLAMELLQASVFIPTDDAALSKIKVCVLGSGAFGTAMGFAAAAKGHDVVMYTRSEDQAESINTEHRNNKTMSDYVLPPNMTATTNLARALDGCELIMSCLPAQTTPGFFAEHRGIIPCNVLICNTAKGLYLETKELLEKPVHKALQRACHEPQPYAVLSGPSFAQEILSKQPTVVVVASTHLYHAVAIQRWLSSRFFRIYTCQDVVGVQLGGALKNPLAIGAGFIHGSGLGINTLSSYVTRSCAELQKICVAMGGKPETVNGLSGIGDLMLTCFGANLSRNCKCGQRLAKGDSLADIIKDYTVEGVPTAEVAIYLADICGLDLPIFRAVHHALKGTIDIREMPALLMNRPLAGELD